MKSTLKKCLLSCVALAERKSQFLSASVTAGMWKLCAARFQVFSSRLNHSTTFPILDTLREPLADIDVATSTKTCLRSTASNAPTSAATD